MGVIYDAIRAEESRLYAQTPRWFPFAGVVLPRAVHAPLAMEVDPSGFHYVLEGRYDKGGVAWWVGGFPIEWSPTGETAFVTKEGHRIPFAIPSPEPEPTAEPAEGGAL